MNADNTTHNGDFRGPTDRCLIVHSSITDQMAQSRLSSVPGAEQPAVNPGHVPIKLKAGNEDAVTDDYVMAQARCPSPAIRDTSIASGVPLTNSECG